MKRIAIALLLFSLTPALSLPLCADQAVAQARWIGLYIPPQDRMVDLGTVDSSCYDIETASWCTISDGERHRVWIFVLPWSKKIPTPAELAGLPDETSSALPRSVNYSLVVTARDTGPTRIDDLSDLQISGGDLEGWTGLDRAVTLYRVTAFGIFRVSDIRYRYRVDLRDRPGTYEATITYTLVSS